MKLNSQTPIPAKTSYFSYLAKHATPITLKTKLNPPNPFKMPRIS
jgi:hypothetical protein